MNLRRRMHAWTCVFPLAIALAACGGDSESTPTPQAPAPSTVSTEAAADTVQRAKLDLNTATREDVLTIPGVGDNMVREFFEYRPYVSIQQFRREIGKYVDEAQVAAYERYVYVPVNPNESDAATLQQLPGVDETTAAALIDGRPYASAEAFLEALGAHVTGEEQTAAGTYLTAP